jgi:hypothetical protein
MQQIAKTLQILLVTIIITGCKNANEQSQSTTVTSKETNAIALVSDLGVYDLSADSKYMEELTILDQRCPDLMKPPYLLEDREAILESWTALNQNIGQKLMDKGFNWESAQEQVKIFHRFYFHKDGSIHRYYFNILDSTVSKEKREAYSKAVADILQNHCLGIERDSAFAQCGKMAFQVR